MGGPLEVGLEASLGRVLDGVDVVVVLGCCFRLLERIFSRLLILDCSLENVEAVMTVVFWALSRFSSSLVETILSEMLLFNEEMVLGRRLGCYLKSGRMRLIKSGMKCLLKVVISLERLKDQTLLI